MMLTITQFTLVVISFLEDPDIGLDLQGSLIVFLILFGVILVKVILIFFSSECKRTSRLFIYAEGFFQIFQACL